MKQVCLLLIGNGFGLEGKDNREIVNNLVRRILD